jgi:hypothetical protein
MSIQKLESQVIVRNEPLIELAEKLKLELRETIVKPTAIVEIKSDKGVIHGWRAEHAAQASTLSENEYSKEDSFILKELAISEMKTYWGGMIQNGADTFWELYNPHNKEFSPYGSQLINSYCHAWSWSCTPTYLIRNYNL